MPFARLLCFKFNFIVKRLIKCIYGMLETFLFPSACVSGAGVKAKRSNTMGVDGFKLTATRVGREKSLYCLFTGSLILMLLILSHYLFAYLLCI